MTIEQRPVSEYLALDNAANSAGGGGGGGHHDKMMASQGHLPDRALDQLTPPEVVIRNEHPKMTAEATVIVPPQVNLPNNRLPNLGDPRSAVFGPPSNGIGYGSAIGSGAGLGIGSGNGGGVGAGFGEGIGGGVFRAGGGVSAPRAMYKQDPEDSSEAYQAYYLVTGIVSII